MVRSIASCPENVTLGTAQALTGNFLVSGVAPGATLEGTVLSGERRSPEDGIRRPLAGSHHLSARAHRLAHKMRAIHVHVTGAVSVKRSRPQIPDGKAALSL